MIDNIPVAIPTNPLDSILKLPERDKLGIQLRYFALANNLLQEVIGKKHGVNNGISKSPYTARLFNYLRTTIQECGKEYDKIDNQDYAAAIFHQFQHNMLKQERVTQIQYDILNLSAAIGILRGAKDTDRLLQIPLENTTNDQTIIPDEVKKTTLEEVSELVSWIKTEKPVLKAETAEIKEKFSADVVEENEEAIEAKAPSSLKKGDICEVDTNLYNRDNVERCIKGLQLCRAIMASEINATNSNDKILRLESIGRGGAESIKEHTCTGFKQVVNTVFTNEKRDITTEWPITEPNLPQVVSRRIWSEICKISPLLGVPPVAQKGTKKISPN